MSQPNPMAGGQRTLSPLSSVGARLDRLPICSFHYRILVLLGSGLFLDAFDIYMQGAILAELVRQHWSGPLRNASFLSITFAGLTVGTILSGWMGDRWGRRTMYRANLLVFGLATFAAGLAPNFHFLLGCRFICGLGLGGEVITCYATLAEFVPAGQRGRWQGFLSFISNLGLPLSALVCWLIIPTFGWRAMFLLVGVLALIAWALQRAIPESPRWYEEQHRHTEADALVRRIEEEFERATGRSLQAVSDQVRVAPASKQGSWRLLFQGVLLRRTLLAITIMVCMNVVVYAVTAWLPTILLRGGFLIGRALWITTVMQLGSLPGALLGAWIIDRWGRRLGLISFSGLCALMVLMYQLTYTVPALILSGFILFVLLYGLTTMSFSTYVPEIFPTRLRLTGSGISNSTGRLANVVAPFGVAALLTEFGASSVYYAVSSVLVLQALVMLFLGEETRGRSLEDIERMIE